MANKLTHFGNSKKLWEKKFDQTFKLAHKLCNLENNQFRPTHKNCKFGFLQTFQPKIFFVPNFLRLTRVQSR